MSQIDTQIDTIFIDDNELFDKDELIDENKAFIKTLLDKANYKDSLDNIKDDQQKVIQDDLSNVPMPTTADTKTEIIDDVAPPNVPLFFLTENEIFDDVVPADVFTPKTEKFIPELMPPQKTGIKSVDDKNYEDYLKVLQIYRPDLFIDEEGNNNYVMPTPKTETEIIDDVLPADIFTPKTEEFIPDLTSPQKTGIKSVDDKNYEDYLKVLQIYRADLFIDEEDNNNYVILTPKTEIVETEDVPPTPLKPIPIIPQETVKLPKTIPKTYLPENIDIISAISELELVQISLIMLMETTTLLNNKHLTMT